MEVRDHPSRPPSSKPPFLDFVTGALIALGLFVLFVFLHALLSSPYLVPPIFAFGGALVALAAASALAGVYLAWTGHPGHRKAVLFVVGITLATLVAHAYIIGTPAAATPASVSGSPTAGFKDGYISVNGSQVGPRLALTVTDVGTDAVAALSVSSGGVALSQVPGAFPLAAPSFAAPLEPDQTFIGAWSLPSNATAGEVTVRYQYLSCYSTDKQGYGCIMDEVYYVPEAMAIYNGTQCSFGYGAPTFCHLEHPFLAPALIAAGMAVFGEYSAAGWRVMPALLGTFSVPLLFGIAWKLSEDKKVAYVAAVLFALDVMFFSQSSAGLLDVPEVFFALAAYFAYFANLRWWKFDRHVVAGVLLGASGLSKETAVFGAMALLTYILFFGDGDRWTRLYHVLKVALVVGIVFAAGMQAYDTTLAPSVPTFANQVGYILSYGSGLTAKQLACSPTTGYWCKYANDPGGPPILPTDWLVYYSPVSYFLVSAVSNPGNIHYVDVGYYGITNLMVTWTTFVWVPLVAWNLFAFWRSRKPKGEAQTAPPPSGTAAAASAGLVAEPIKPEERAAPDQGSLPMARYAGFSLILMAWTYVPYLFLFLGQRVTYPFYVIPAIPAISMGASYWLTKRWFPRPLLAVYLAMVFVFFLVYFPDKAFLPLWLRALLRH